MCFEQYKRKIIPEPKKWPFFWGGVKEKSPADPDFRRLGGVKEKSPFVEKEGGDL